MPRRFSPVVPVALVFLAAFPALLAQRGTSGGSMSSAHFAGAVHAGPSSLSATTRSFAPPSAAPHQTLQAHPARHWPSPDHHPGDGRTGVGYRRSFPSVYAGYPWLNSFGYGLPLAYGVPYGGDQDTVPEQPDQPMIDPGQESSGPQVAANAPPPYRPPYQGTADASPVHPQPATTLIFNDGRPPMQVHNYALTATTLYALDGDSRQEISLSQLNVTATAEANHAHGVDFALPVSH